MGTWYSTTLTVDVWSSFTCLQLLVSCVSVLSCFRCWATYLRSSSMCVPAIYLHIFCVLPSIVTQLGMKLPTTLCTALVPEYFYTQTVLISRDGVVPDCNLFLPAPPPSDNASINELDVPENPYVVSPPPPPFPRPPPSQCRPTAHGQCAL